MDSTLLVTTSSADLRVVHTQMFTSGVYNTEQLSKAEPKQLDAVLAATADLDSGVGRVAALLKSDFSNTFSQSVKAFSGRLAVLTQKGVQTCIHLTWQQSIYEFKKQVHDDLI